MGRRDRNDYVFLTSEARCQKRGRAELLAGLKFDNASSIVAEGRLVMTRNMTHVI